MEMEIHPVKIGKHCNNTTSHSKYNSTSSISMCQSTSTFHKRLRLHDKDKPYSCHMCGKTFNMRSNFVRHVRLFTHQGSTNSFGSGCEEDMDSNFGGDETGIDNDMETDLAKLVETDAGCSQWECKVCGKRIRFKSDMLKHTRSHTGYKPFVCGLCGKSFSQGSNLYRHVRVMHRSCNDGMTQRKVGLNNTSGIVGPSRSRWRADASRRGGNHGNHQSGVQSSSDHDTVTSHQGDAIIGQASTNESKYDKYKPYECGTCGERFLRMSDIIKHVRVHTGDQPFKSSLCDKICADRSNLNSLVKNNHVEESKEGERESDSVNGLSIGIVADGWSVYLNKFDANGTNDDNNLDESAATNVSRENSHCVTDNESLGEGDTEVQQRVKMYARRGGVNKVISSRCEERGSVSVSQKGQTEINKRNQRGELRRMLAKGEKSYKCIGCDRRFSHFCNLYQHKRRMHNKCRLIPKRRKPTKRAPSCGSGPTSLELIVNGDKSFKCSQCDECGRILQSLFKHIMRNHTERSVRSPSDSFSNSTLEKVPGGVEAPVEKRLKLEKTHKCSLCALTFTQCSSLYRHVRRMHKDRTDLGGKDSQSNSNILLTEASEGAGVFTKIIRDGEKKTFLCPVCDRSFNYSSNCRKHVKRLHQDYYKHQKGTKPTASPRSSRSSDGTVRVVKSCMDQLGVGEKPYKCSECVRAFCSVGNAYKHMRRMHKHCVIRRASDIARDPDKIRIKILNKRENPYKCFSCRARFTNPSHLHIHMRTFHKGAKTLQTKKVKTLKLKRTISSTNRYKCSQCGYTSDFRSNVYKHMRRIHKISPTRSDVWDRRPQTHVIDRKSPQKLVVHKNETSVELAEHENETPVNLEVHKNETPVDLEAHKNETSVELEVHKNETPVELEVHKNETPVELISKQVSKVLVNNKSVTVLSPRRRFQKYDDAITGI